MDRHLNPNVTAIYVSTDDVISRMNDGALLILRSTVYPGVTQLIYDRIRSLGRRIPLAFCPERIAEGKAIEEMSVLPQIVSAFDDEAMARARALFLKLTSNVMPASREMARDRCAISQNQRTRYDRGPNYKTQR